jgi:cathepsin B
MPQCIKPIKNQRNCGCCYAFPVTAVLESRIWIHSNGALRPELSQQDIVSCDDNNMNAREITYIIPGDF